MTKVKFCIECHHYRSKALDQNKHNCAHPKVRTETTPNLVTGTQSLPSDCASARSEGRNCGPNGWLWERAHG